MTVVPVPETSMRKQNRAKLRKDEIGFAGQPALMEPEPETRRMKPPPENHFRLGVGAPDAGHHPASDFNGYDVSH